MTTEFKTDRGQTVKLGRIRPKATPNVLRLGAYLNRGQATTPPPDAVDYTARAMESIKHMYLNDQYGDCVIAGKYHAVGVWSGNDGPVAVVGSDTEVLNSYRTICGPGDNGCNITSVLDYMKAHGLTLNGVPHKIDGYVSVDWTNPDEVKVALYLFGALTIGINLPNDWLNGPIWDVTTSRIVGGHDVTVVGYNPTGAVIATWGGTRLITWKAFTSRKWLEECYALLSPDWYGNDNLAPCGVDVATLRADLAKLGGGVIPPIPVPPPNPTPGPTPTPTPTPPPGPAPGPVPWDWIVQLLKWLLGMKAGTATLADMPKSWPSPADIAAILQVVVQVITFILQYLQPTPAPTPTPGEFRTTGDPDPNYIPQHETALRQVKAPIPAVNIPPEILALIFQIIQWILSQKQK